MKLSIRAAFRTTLIAAIAGGSLALAPLTLNGHTPHAFAANGHTPHAFATCRDDDKYKTDGTITVHLLYRCNVGGLGNAASVDVYYNNCTGAAGWGLIALLYSDSSEYSGPGISPDGSCTNSTGFYHVGCGSQVHGRGIRQSAYFWWQQSNDVSTDTISASC